MTQTLANNRSAEFVLRAGEVVVASGSGEAIFSAVGMQRQITFQAGIVQTLGPYDIDGDLTIRGFAGGLAYDVEGAPDRGSTESHIQIFGFSGLGQFLTAVLDHGFTATSYLWSRSLDGGRTYADIAGATGRIYQQTSADVVGSKIRVVPVGLSLSSSEFLIGAVVGGSLSISGTPVTTGSPSVPYAGFSVAGAGGTAPYTYSVASGSLPAGLTLNTASGAVSGTPTTLGTSAGIVLRVTDSAGATADLAPFSIVIASVAALGISGSAPTSGTTGVAYSGDYDASGGTAPYVFSVASGALPTGVSLDSATGVLSGTPSAAGSFTFAIRVTDAVSAVATASAVTAVIAASDVTAPTASGAVVANASPTVVAVTFSEAMNTSAVPATSAITVSGHTVALLAWADSTHLNVTVTAAFVNGEAARTLAYTQPGTNNLRDAAGNLLANIASLAITNNVALDTRPGWFAAPATAATSGTAGFVSGRTKLTGSANLGKAGTANPLTTTTGQYAWFAIANAGSVTFHDDIANLNGGFTLTGSPFVDGNGTTWYLYKSDFPASYTAGSVTIS